MQQVGHWLSALGSNPYAVGLATVFGILSGLWAVFSFVTRHADKPFRAMRRYRRKKILKEIRVARRARELRKIGLSEYYISLTYWHDFSLDLTNALISLFNALINIIFYAAHNNIINGCAAIIITLSFFYALLSCKRAAWKAYNSITWSLTYGSQRRKFLAELAKLRIDKR